MDAAASALDGVAHGVDLDDVALMVSELTTNAARYSASGLPGGGVRVRVLAGVGAGPGLRVEIEDDGGSETRPAVVPSVDGEHWTESGRGLLMVEALADRWGYFEEEGRVTVWFECSRSSLTGETV